MHAWSVATGGRTPRWAVDTLVTAAHALGSESLVFADAVAEDELGLRVALVTDTRVVRIAAESESEQIEDLRRDDAEWWVEVFSIERLASLRLSAHSREAMDGARQLGYDEIRLTTESGSELVLPLGNAILDQEAAVRLVERLRGRLV